MATVSSTSSILITDMPRLSKKLSALQRAREKRWLKAKQKESPENPKQKSLGSDNICGSFSICEDSENMPHCTCSLKIFL